MNFDAVFCNVHYLLMAFIYLTMKKIWEGGLHTMTVLQKNDPNISDSLFLANAISEMQPLRLTDRH